MFKCFAVVRAVGLAWLGYGCRDHRQLDETSRMNNYTTRENRSNPSLKKIRSPYLDLSMKNMPPFEKLFHPFARI